MLVINPTKSIYFVGFLESSLGSLEAYSSDSYDRHLPHTLLICICPAEHADGIEWFPQCSDESATTLCPSAYVDFYLLSENHGRIC